MQLLTQVIATGTAGADGSGGGFDPWKLVGIPAAVAAIVGLVTGYAVGVFRPLLVKRPRYWHAGGRTWFSCVVRNRSFFGDRRVTALTVVTVPGWLKRTFWPFWKRRGQAAELIPFGLPAVLPTLGKRNEDSLQGELRKIDVPGVYEPGARLRLLAHAGSRSSRSKRLEKIDK